MIKVFLVEDEFFVREGIKNNIDWEGHGYEFCGEASDGELAFPMIKKEKPDIVITDIRMPFMNGLELSQLIKKEMPWVEIIILSGFEEFEYAKEAIKIGVSQYLTKPISGGDLLKELDSLKEKIKENKKEREIREKYLKETKENIISERKVFFKSLVTGAKTSAELIADSEKLGINITSIFYNIMLLKAHASTHTQEEFSQRLVSIEEEIERLIDEKFIIMFDRDLEGKAYLFKADTRDELLLEIADFTQKLEAIFEKYEGIGYFGATGACVERIGDLPHAFETASKAFTKRYFSNENTFVSYDDTEKIDIDIGFNVEEFDNLNPDLKRLDRSKIKEFLKLGGKSETEYFVDEYLSEFGVNAIKSKIFRQYIMMDIYLSVAEFIGGIIDDDTKVDISEYKPDITCNDEESKNYIISVINKGISIREGNASGHNNDVVSNIKAYIEENFADEGISLNSMASHVNFSPNHLSMVFSQQTGNTIIKYLTDFRMNKAKELLKCTNKKSSEISLMVGYKDPHYFSYLFKKTQGMTPTQFRES